MALALSLGHRAVATGKSPAFLRQLRRSLQLVFAALLAACILYLVQANSLVARGYHLGALQQQVERLRQQNRDLESQALTLQSLQHLSAEVSQLQMVPAGTVRYLPTLPPATARVDSPLR